MYPIVIEKTSEDGLTVEMWRFTLIDRNLVLDDYLKIVRPSRRHKTGKEVGHYNRILGRDSTLTEADVPWSEELAAEALRLYVSTIRVGRWKIDLGR